MAGIAAQPSHSGGTPAVRTPAPAIRHEVAEARHEVKVRAPFVRLPRKAAPMAHDGRVA